jgi:hypothetical protein
MAQYFMLGRFVKQFFADAPALPRQRIGRKIAP